MIKRLTHIKLMLIAMIAMTSCIYDYPHGDEIIDEEGRRVVFSLRIDEELATRTWGDDYDADLGTSFDSRIKDGALQVFFYDLSDHLMGKAESIMYWSESASVYTFVGDISHINLIAGNTYKVVVLVNCPEAIEKISSLIYSIDDISYPNGYIPMVGFMQHTLSADNLQQLGTIDVLRSVAKTVVRLSDAMYDNGYRLTSASIDHYNAEGYCMPKGWESVSRTKDLNQEECHNSLHSHHNPGNGLSFASTIAGKEMTIYLPEFNVLHATDNRPSISVTLNRDGADMIYSNAISFCQYNSNGEAIPGSEYNITRNHLYNYTISGISSSLLLEYEVVEWEDGGTWNRGVFQYPTYHNPVIPDLQEYLHNPEKPITTSPVMTYNNVNPEAGAFSVWFRMTEPIGQKWMPVVDQSDMDYTIKVYDLSYRELTSPSQWVAADTWYNIKVIPRNADKAGDIVNFGITYTQDWMPSEMSMYLLINGENNKIAWPNSGNSPQRIAILQQ